MLKVGIICKLEEGKVKEIKIKNQVGYTKNNMKRGIKIKVNRNSAKVRWAYTNGK